MPFREPSPPPRPPTPPPQLTAAGRTIRTKRKTWKLLQQLPEAPLSVPEQASEPVPEPAAEPPVLTWTWEGVRTTVNSFGLFRDYPSTPTYNPDDLLGLDDLSDIPAGTRSNTATLPASKTPFATSATSATNPLPDSSPLAGPFPNKSIEGLVTWTWTGSSTKSLDEVEKLVTFLKSDEFKKEDIADLDIKRATAALDAFLASSANKIRDGWQEVSVEISVPNGMKHKSEADAPIFEVPGLFYRPIVEVIKSAVQTAGARCFHYTPFKQFWRSSPDGPPERVSDEIYSSDAMVEAHTALQKQPREPNCALERVVLALMWWSDSTHLASFGNASLWPLYLFFGNQSKWLRAKPRSNLCHHVAYFPKVSRHLAWVELQY